MEDTAQPSQLAPVRERLSAHLDVLLLKQSTIDGLAPRIADNAVRRGFPLDWALRAIDDVADEVFMLKESGQAPTYAQVINLLLRWTRAPRKPITKADRLEQAGERDTYGSHDEKRATREQQQREWETNVKHTAMRPRG
jgi:hypothetical protein